MVLCARVTGSREVGVGTLGKPSGSGSAHAVLVRNGWKRDKLARWQVYSPSHSESKWKAIERTE